MLTFPIFHLAFPVFELEAARHFYIDVLGARLGRETPKWIDIHLFGAQITLHEQAAQVLARGEHGVRHFGAVLEWDDWDAFGRQLTERGMTFRSRPHISHAGTDDEQGKFLLDDPSGNIIEVKAYRKPALALNMGEPDAIGVAPKGSLSV